MAIIVNVIETSAIKRITVPFLYFFKTNYPKPGSKSDK
jgi:hypothetical protein